MLSGGEQHTFSSGPMKQIRRLELENSVGIWIMANMPHWVDPVAGSNSHELNVDGEKITENNKMQNMAEPICVGEVCLFFYNLFRFISLFSEIDVVT